jgi:predicted DNA-binding transcriptional regulator YafY
MVLLGVRFGASSGLSVSDTRPPSLTSCVRDTTYGVIMRASPLLAILLLLQSRGRMSAPQLSEELEVSVCTIYRDLEALSAAGVPVYAETGPKGGVHLIEGYQTRLTGLNAEEAEALLLAGVPGPLGDLGPGAAVIGGQRKLLAALPPGLRAHATRARERCHLDLGGWFQRQVVPPALGQAATAVWEDRRMAMSYEPDVGPPWTREVDPLGLV